MSSQVEMYGKRLAREGRIVRAGQVCTWQVTGRERDQECEVYSMEAQGEEGDGGDDRGSKQGPPYNGVNMSIENLHDR